MGHEASATILESGPGVSDDILKAGDKVAIEPGVPCRSCERCSEGTYNLCPGMRFAASFYEEEDASGKQNGDNVEAGVMRATPGVLSKYYVLPASLCYKVSESVDLQEAVFVEPLAVAVHAVRLAGLNPMIKTVLITGAGTIGLVTAAVSCAYGANKVILVDVNAKKLESAKKWLCGEKGAATLAGVTILTFDSSRYTGADETASALKTECDVMSGIDAVIEASGHPSATALSIKMLRSGGSMVQTGLSKTPGMDNFPIVDLSEKEIHLHGAFRYKAGDFAVARDLLGKGVVGPIGELISKVWEFEEYEDAWKATRDGMGSGVKNLIRGVQD